MTKECCYVECFGNPGYSVELVALLMRVVENPAWLRGSRMQRAYDIYKANGGQGIVDGLQENLFPYSLVLLVLEALTGESWKHYIYADSKKTHKDHNEEGCPMLINAMQAVGGNEGFRGIVLRNPRHLQSQPQIDHCHLLVPVKDELLESSTYIHNCARR